MLCINLQTIIFKWVDMKWYDDKAPSRNARKLGIFMRTALSFDGNKYNYNNDLVSG